MKISVAPAQKIVAKHIEVANISLGYIITTNLYMSYYIVKPIKGV